jgi:formylglycine-generating enzyme required for sulfatase activity/calcineurin-like phosphoesterase family protein
MSEITILHMSDVHFKTKEKETTPTFRQDVTTKMIAAVQQHLDKHHAAPDVVAVTGDIAFSGKEYEYDNAKMFFKDLKAVLPSKTDFLAVPGNHDVERDKVDPLFPLYETIIEKELIDGFLNNEKHIQDFINIKFKNFRAFIHEVIPGLYPTNDDYFWVKDFKDNKVSFLGLNSCWASGKDNEAARIALGYPQVMKALALAKQENKIILMHHPLFDWLEEKDICKCRGEIFNRCSLLLHGHRHVDDQLVLKSPSGSCICLGANASYTKDKNGFIGFQFVNVEFRYEGAEVAVWPYRMDPRNRVKFVPDTHRWNDQEGKPYFQLKTDELDEEGEETYIPFEILREYKNLIKKIHSTMGINLLAKNRDEAVVSLARNLQYKMIESDAALQDRFQAGMLVGELGDIRISGNNMVLIPAGEFIRGSNEFKEEEKPEKCIYLDGFKIGKYPVTNQEFKQFIDEKGYYQEEFWLPEGWQWRCRNGITEPLFWSERSRYWSNFPVTGINWYEAAAYANWLKKVTGILYRLPTEVEWEKAARGTDGKLYPWGYTFDINCCNSRESGLRRTSPVGIFPNGKSDYGCQDMAGNVWEWCADWFDEKYYHGSSLKNPIGPTTGSLRMCRGGGWFVGVQDCACAIRRRLHPGNRVYDLGFRLARSF